MQHSVKNSNWLYFFQRYWRRACNALNKWQYKIKFTSYNAATEFVNEHFESLRSRYQGNLETSVRGSDFIFDSVQLKECQKVNFRRAGSYIDSPDWIKKKEDKSENYREKIFNMQQLLHWLMKKSSGIQKKF